MQRRVKFIYEPIGVEGEARLDRKISQNRTFEQRPAEALSQGGADCRATLFFPSEVEVRVIARPDHVPRDGDLPFVGRIASATQRFTSACAPNIVEMPNAMKLP